MGGYNLVVGKTLHKTLMMDQPVASMIIILQPSKHNLSDNKIIVSF